MGRLIDEIELKKQIVYSNILNDGITLDDLDQIISEVPTIVPRKKGKWINIRHDNIGECDQCGITGRAWMNFCFNCGADMREEGEADDS